MYSYLTSRRLLVLLSLFFLFTISRQSSAQSCQTSITANPLVVCYGDTSHLSATGYIQFSGGYSFDFNNSAIPSGWSSGASSTFGTPCVASPTNSPYYWAGSAGSSTPYVMTNGLDVSSGGNIEFKMIFSVQGGNTPCEGPDEQDEGVSVQYSTNGGATWVDIIYYSPGGFTLPSNPGGNTPIASGPTAYTVWNTFTVPIPPAAATTNTRFRWIQFNSSGACCDNWGLDDINILAGSTSAYNFFQWSNGASGMNMTDLTLQNIISDTLIIVTITDTATGFSCSDTIAIQLDNPIAAFTSAPTCNMTLNAVDSSIPDLSPITGWAWNFGDTTTSTQQNPGHVYANTGSYNVQLIITTQNGCQDSVIMPVQVDEDPVAYFLLPGNCGLNVTFTDSSYVPNNLGVISGWAWDFGDMGTSSAQNGSHTYGSANTWNVTLTVTDSRGCTDTYTQPFTSNPFPSANFIYSSACLGDSTQFTDQSGVQFSSISSWNWNFGNGNTSVLQNPDYTFAQPGTYSVELIVMSAGGCEDTVQHTITVYPYPVADFSASEVCSGFTTDFTDLSTIQFGNITGYTWDFGDPSLSQSNQVNPSAFYANHGQYTVNLTVVGDNGCTTNYSELVNVWPKPVLDFTADPLAGCWPVEPEFDNLSTIASGSITTWSWTFGDGNTSTQFEPQHLYPNAPGLYTVSLYAISDRGCDTSITKTDYITVYPQPTAQFSYEPSNVTVLKPQVQFINLSVMGESYEWDLGDGNTSTIANPVHIYSDEDTGTYVIQLITYNVYGCMDTIEHTVHVNPTYTIYVPNAFSPNGDGINDEFKIVGIGIVEADLLIFNRWGEAVARLEKDQAISVGWDGKYAGELLKQDVYVYKLVVKDIFGGIHEFHGQISLLP